MPYEIIPDLDQELRADEGCVRVPMKDTKGRWVCGVGCDLKAHRLVKPNGFPLSMAPWTDDDIEKQLGLDMLNACREVHTHLPWSINLDAVRSRPLVNMMFQMGWGDGNHGLSSFKQTLKHIKDGRWKKAALGIRQSKYGRVDAPARAQRNAYRIETGNYHMPANFYPPPPKAA